MTGEISGTILRTRDQAFIPDDGGNRDRAEFLEWLAEGNTPDPPEPLPEPAPAEPSVADLLKRIAALEARLQHGGTA